MDGSEEGSECSYESVASEGGYQPASERGRDPVPRIVSSSYCVEIFRRMRWTDQTYCGRQPSSDNKENNVAKPAGGKKGKNKKGEGESEKSDPFIELPTRLMRFDGAMEAWLEELPLPREPRRRFIPYNEVSDAADRFPNDLSVLRSGNRKAVLWYFSPEFLQQLWPLFFLPNTVGLKLWVQMLIDQRCTVQSTHVALGEINAPRNLKAQAKSQWLKSVFQAMQTAKWTPDGEARQLLLKRRLTHAGMSIGDAVQIDNELYMVALSGFTKVKEAPLVLPPRDPDAVGQEDSKGEGKGKNRREKKSKKNDWRGEKGPPMDRRGLRAELQRRRNNVNGKGVGADKATNGVARYAGASGKGKGKADDYDDEANDNDEEPESGEDDDDEECMYLP